MKATTTVTRFDGRIYWIASRCCLSEAEARAANAALDALPSPESFLPEFAPAIALADGELATGGGMATHHVDPGPELTPAQKVLIELADEDAPTSHLKAGEAVA